MHTIEWVAGILATVFGIPLGVAVVRAAKWGWPRFQRWRTRGGRIDAAIAALLKDVSDVKAEVSTNGGKSLKDVVMATNNRLNFEVAARRATEHRAVWEGAVHPDGIIRPDFVSAHWTRITGQSREDTANGGWALAVHPDDRDDVIEAATEANDAGRVFVREYRAVNVLTGVETTVKHISRPVKDDRGVVTGWVGELTQLFV